MTEKALLEVRGLCKSFPSGDRTLEVLRDVELRVPEGATVAVMGASGSGKSTFLHLTGGMEKPDSGEIWVDGEDIARLQGRRLALYRNRKVGFVFQFHHLLSEFSALENVMFPLLLRGESFAQSRNEAARWLDEVGLSPRAHHKPGQLSGGEQQRVAIARALVGSPSLLLADEPTGDLDDKTSDSIHQLLMQLQGRHRLTSVIVTHDASLAGLCSQRRRMVGGHLVPVDD
ncbi:MAG TPA: ABC transporter ATP-binding protein [Acidobacteriota bacterium]|nr:ABC transporter ATP-binding protein [Acidobacteriota bacterium]